MFEDVCRVGYALNAKKMRKSSADAAASPAMRCHKTTSVWKGGGLADILHVTDDKRNNITEGVEFCDFDAASPGCGYDQEFDVIIHKLTEDIERTEPSLRLSNLTSYLENHPNTVIVDPIESVRNVISRETCCHLINSIEQDKGDEKKCRSPLCQPNYFIIQSPDDDVEELMKRHEVYFPVICKPVTACGTPDSHMMSVIMRKEDLHLIKPPCVAQQYYDHGASFYKVYVIGDDVMAFQRPSLPDLCSLLAVERSRKQAVKAGDAMSSSSADSAIMVRSLVFDSRKTYPKLDDFLIEPGLVYPTTSPIASSSSSSALRKENDSKLECYDGKDDIVRVAETAGGSAKDNEANNSIDGNVVTDPDKNNRVTENEPGNRKPCNSNLMTGTPSVSSELRIPRHRLTEAAKALADTFGLTLFGFDVLIPSEQPARPMQFADRKLGTSIAEKKSIGGFSNTGISAASEATVGTNSVTQLEGTQNLHVIDVNFFPSYKEVEDFPSRLRAFLRSRRKRKANIDIGSSPAVPEQE